METQDTIDQLIDFLNKNPNVKYVNQDKLNDSLNNGFIIDKNHRFLLGDFTITHNSCKAKHSTNSRPIKGLKERITGKDGVIRNAMLGKRCEQSARTVIGPDITLKLGQVAIPPEIAANLTIPVQVTNYNKEFLNKLVNDNKANFITPKDSNVRINLEYKLFSKGTLLKHGDIIVRKDTEMTVFDTNMALVANDKIIRNGIEIVDVKYPEKIHYELNVGDIVQRQLMDGDIVIVNRQPTQM